MGPSCGNPTTAQAQSAQLKTGWANMTMLLGNTQTQKMADLPIERLEHAAPFTYIAINCFGPYTVTERKNEIKRYGIVFVCQASSAIHLELLDDRSTYCFLNQTGYNTIGYVRCLDYSGM